MQLPFSSRREKATLQFEAARLVDRRFLLLRRFLVDVLVTTDF